MISMFGVTARHFNAFVSSLFGRWLENLEHFAFLNFVSAA